jgi:hypothetical protein
MCSCAPIVAPAGMLRATVQVVAENVDSTAFARAFVMCEFVQVRDGQSQLLAVEGCPVLSTFSLLKSSDVKKPVRCPNELSHANGVQMSVLRLEGPQSSSSS